MPSQQFAVLNMYSHILSQRQPAIITHSTKYVTATYLQSSNRIHSIRQILDWT